MLEVVYTKRFDKSMFLARRRGKDVSKAMVFIELLRTGQPLPVRCKDHSLIGNYAGTREFKVEPDWLIIYRIDSGVLRLIDTGTHSDLFD
jgi:mRNA interferase YafQ